jgi:hypothetical protein
MSRHPFAPGAIEHHREPAARRIARTLRALWRYVTGPRAF